MGNKVSEGGCGFPPPPPGALFLTKVQCRDWGHYGTLLEVVGHYGRMEALQQAREYCGSLGGMGVEGSWETWRH